MTIRLDFSIFFIWYHHIEVIMPDCLSGHRGSNPRGIAIKVCSQYLVAEKLGVEEETKESLYLVTVFWE